MKQFFAITTMRYAFTAIIITIMGVSLFAQSSKTDAFSSMMLSKVNEAQASSEKDKLKTYDFIQSRDDAYFIKSLVKVRSEAFEADLINRGGRVIVKAGNIWGVEIPVDAIDAVLKNDDLARLSVSRTMQLNNEKARSLTQVENLHQGETGTALKGEGVIVGVGDTGIDIEHPAFKDASGSRVQYLWDMSNTTGINMPEGYDFGREFTAYQIDNGQCSHLDVHGHGTHVTGTAAGGAIDNTKHIGMAPKSDIVLVKVSKDADSRRMVSELELVAGVKWIFDKADEMAKPCVVNLSLGGVLGPHDGTSLVSQGMSNLTGPGRIIVAACGNSGQMGLHSGTNFSAGEYYETLLLPFGNLCNIDPELCPENIQNFFALGSDMWFSANSIDSIYVSAYSMNPQTGKLTFDESLGFGAGDVAESYPLTAEETTLGYVSLDFTKNNLPENNSGNVLVMIHNDGKLETPVQFKIWSVAVKTKSEGAIHTFSAIPVPKYMGYDGIMGERLYGDTYMSVGAPADGRDIISVGSYVNRDKFTDDSGKDHEFESAVGSYSTFSSPGPLRDGRLAPLVSAPGENVVSALSTASSEYEYTIDGYYVSMSGTSMASPVVTGAVALMLQVKPDLSPDELKVIFEKTSITDEFTGNTPNNYVGYGKLNALAAVKYLLNTNVEEYDFVSDPVGIYPNPAYENISISKFEPGMQFIIFDAAGRALKVIDNASEISVQDLPSGAYYLNVVSGKSSYAVPFAVRK